MKNLQTLLTKPMEFGQSSGDGLKKRMSLGLSVADEKIKLIDVLCEDDYFLVASPFPHPSLQSSISGMEEKEVPESRPSFLRRSLAWDSAFFSNSGVLDADELFFINNGANETSLLPADHEVRNRRPESENDGGFSADWFEIQPSIFESKPSKALNMAAERSSKSGLKQNHQSSKRFDGSSRISKPMMNTYQTSKGKSIDVQSQSRLKRESSIRRTSGSKNFSGLSNLKMDDKSIRTFLGKEKPTYKSSSNLQPTSLAKFCHTFSQTPAAASTLPKRETESKKTPTSNVSRLSSIRKKWIPNINTSTHSPISFSSPANSTTHFPSATLLSPVHKQRRSVDSKDVKEATNLQRTLQVPKKNGSLPAKSMRPSGLRPPSPLHRFFDEGTPQHTERSRKMPHKTLKNPSAAVDEQDRMKELDNLCRNFEAVALESEKISGGGKACSVSKEESKQPNSKIASSRRTPLADKTSKSNFATTIDPKKEKLVRRASSVRYC